MPIKKVKGGYKWGKHGKVYKTRAGAARQARAAYAHGYRGKQIMNIIIKTIPHKEHRYDTVGNWWFDEKGNLEIRVSDMKNWKYEFLVALHELVESALCKSRNIKEKDVTNFDVQFEK